MATEKAEALNGARMVRRIAKRIEFCAESLRNATAALERAQKGRGMKCGMIEIAPDAGDVLLYTQEAAKYRAGLHEWREIRDIVAADLSKRGLI